ncbi:MAG: hypothetical protein AB1489_04300 [Acidobacteriota bacterium]
MMNLTIIDFELFKVVGPVLVVLLAFVLSRTRSKWVQQLEYRVGVLARRQGLSVLLVGILTFLGSVAVSLLVRLPVPTIPDEYSYLLAADTFASGRLSNPPHPMWVHFESYYILQQPVYVSKYPPMQGLMLALGQLTTGYPIVGVWLSIALMCSAICWMLQAWMPPRWALLGGVLAMLHIGIASYWSQSYWGGALSACGGALLFGGLRRVIQQPHIRDALLLGIGLVILANSRPYEGLLASIPSAILLLIWIIGQRGAALTIALQRVVLPLLIVLTLAGLATAYYNWHITGNPLMLPYQLYEDKYSPVPNMVWQSPRTDIVYNHQVMHDMYADLLSWYLTYYRSLPRLAMAAWIKIKVFWLFYLGAALTLPLVAFRETLKDRWMIFALLSCGLVLIGFLLTTYTHSHYPAPVTALIFAIVLQSLRHLRCWRWRAGGTGRWIVWLIPMFYVVLLVLRVQADALSTQAYHWSAYRAQLQQQLSESQARHLIIVRYGSEHALGSEWVYNRADIDQAKVVWAREMDMAHNCALINYFRDRQIWLLIVDNDELPPQLLPYTTKACR